MRTVQLSTEVFAAIWAAHVTGEETEDAILRRLLKAPPPAAPPPESPSPSGFTDLRYGVRLPEGFPIERTYKGTLYQAHASSGGWKLQHTGATFPTLRAVGEALGVGIENAWANWFYADAVTGQRQPISKLRDPNTIIPRSKRR